MSWLGFNTAASGMFSSQRKLYTVNHNVTNSERDGYSRQKVNSSATIPQHIPGQGYIGTGIGIDSVERVRDIYLDKKYRTESASLGQWDMKNYGLTQIEGVLRGSEEEGVNVDIDKLFSAIEDLSTDPTDMASRAAFRQSSLSLTKTLNETSSRLQKQQKDLNSEVKTKIRQVNDYADQIRSLNSEIFVMEVDGSNANDLRDQRDLIIDKLSEIVDIEAEERIVNVEESKDGKSIPIKKYEVRIGGISLVDHDMTKKLKYPPRTEDSTINGAEKLYIVEWQDGEPINLKGGELKGLLEVRDGEGKGDNPSNGLPYYVERLDEFAQVLFTKMNEVHYKGSNLNGEDGVFLFSTNDKEINQEISEIMDGKLAAIPPKPKEPKNPTAVEKTDYETKLATYNEKYKEYQDALKEASGLITSDNIAISEDIINDLNNIATIGRDQDVSNIENNDIMKELLATRENPKFFGDDEAYQGKPEDYLTSLLSTLGTDNQQAARMKTVEANIVKGAINQRLSVSGVRLDDEMADMVKFQQIFNASAKMISTFDQIYDTMINRLGMVGR